MSPDELDAMMDDDEASDPTTQEEAVALGGLDPNATYYTNLRQARAMGIRPKN